MVGWKPYFKEGDKVKVLGTAYKNGEPYSIVEGIAVCVKFIRPTPFLGMERWLVKFSDGETVERSITYENKVVN